MIEVHGVSVTVESQRQFKGADEVHREMEDHLNALKMGEVMRNATEEGKAAPNGKRGKGRKATSYAANLVQKIVENMVINVSGVSITYLALEEEGPPPPHTVSIGGGRQPNPVTVIGIGMERLSLQSVDEQNKPTFLDVNAAFLRRRFVIQGVGCWFTRVDQMSRGTQIKPSNPSEYIVQPMDLVAIVIKNTNPIAVPTSPHYSVNISLGADSKAIGEDTGLTIGPWQYKRAWTLIKEVAADSRRKKMTLLHHKFASKAADFRDPVQAKWRWFGAAMKGIYLPDDEITKRFVRTVQKRRTYINEYKREAREAEEREHDPSVEEDVAVKTILQGLETNMPVAAILNFRTVADLEMEKEGRAAASSSGAKVNGKSSRGWFSSFFASSTASQNPENSDDGIEGSGVDDHDGEKDIQVARGNIRQEDKASIYELNFDFQTFSIRMLGEEDRALLTVSMGGKAGAKHYPSKNKFDFSLSTFTVTDGYTTGTMFPHLVSPLPRTKSVFGVVLEDREGGGWGGVLELSVTAHAEERNSNMEVTARLLPLQIVWSKECLQQLNAIFDPGHMDGDVYDAASERVQQFVADQQDKLNSAWASRKRIKCNLEISAPQLVVPLDTRDPNSFVLLCELGNLGMTSEYKTVDPVGSEPTSSSDSQGAWFKDIYGVGHEEITKSSIVLEHWTGKLHGAQLALVTIQHLLQSQSKHDCTRRALAVPNARSGHEEVYRILPPVSTSFDLYIPRFIGGKLAASATSEETAATSEEAAAVPHKDETTTTVAQIGTIVKAEMPEFEVFVFANLATTFSAFQDLLLPKPAAEKGFSQGGLQRIEHVTLILTLTLTLTLMLHRTLTLTLTP